MSDEKTPYEKTTNIFTADDLDTPYPYCLIPQRTRPEMPKRLFENQSVIPKMRSVLSVSTWDGREVLNVKID